MGGGVVPPIKTICLSASHHVTEPNAAMKGAVIIPPNTLPQATALSALNLGTVCVQRLGFEGSRGFCVPEEVSLDWYVFTIIILPK